MRIRTPAEGLRVLERLLKKGKYIARTSVWDHADSRFRRLMTRAMEYGTDVSMYQRRYNEIISKVDENMSGFILSARSPDFYTRQENRTPCSGFNNSSKNFFKDLNR